MEVKYEKNQLEEVENIRDEYCRREESDLEKLKKLDAGVKRPAVISAITVGTAGTLVLGTGLCICLGAIGSQSLLPLGVVLGVVGIAVAVCGWFIYRAVLKARKRKYSQEIITLSDKILGENA